MYYNMLLQFEIDDLHELFEEFGIIKTGDLMTLCRRATGIIREMPLGLDYQKYEKKIVEIFNANRYIKNIESSKNENIISSGHITNNIVFKNVPFFRVVGTIIRPTALIGRETQYITKGKNTFSKDYLLSLLLL